MKIGKHFQDSNHPNNYHDVIFLTLLGKLHCNYYFLFETKTFKTDQARIYQIIESHLLDELSSVRIKINLSAYIGNLFKITKIFLQNKK